MSTNGAGQNSLPIFFLSIVDIDTLASVYMPFISHGGLYIPDAGPHALGDPVFLMLRLMNEKKAWPVSATVSWVVPENSQGTNNGGGVGVRFTDRDNRLKERIEDMLAQGSGQSRKAAPRHKWVWLAR